MFDHFGRRLQRDLKNIVDQRIQNSEQLSGGLMRVRPPSLPNARRLTRLVNGGERECRVAQEAALRSLVWRIATRVDGGSVSIAIQS